MMRFGFEKTASPIYPAYLHVGEYSVALEQTLINDLKTDLSLTNPPLFLEGLTQKIGTNRYLKEMILDGVSKRELEEGGENRLALATRLQKELQTL